MFIGGKTFQPPDQIASQAHRPYLQEAFHSTGSILDRYPLWTPYIFSGMPSFGSLIAAPYTNPMSLILTPIPGVFKVVVYYLLLGIFTWLFLRRQRLGIWPSFFGALAFTFCAHVITMIMFGHNSKIATLVYLPLVLLATSEVWRKPTLRWGAILALAVGTMLVSSHLQVAYYTFLAAGLYMVVATVAALRERMKAGSVLARWVVWGIGLGVGLAASAVLFLSVREYAAHSIRGGTGGGLPYDYATNWSLHPLEITTFFVPGFLGFGGASYWGWMPFTDFPHYMGMLPFFLAVLTLVLWPRERMHVYFLVLGLFALIVAFGRHLPVLYDLMFRFLPYFNKFRVPSMILLLLQFSVAVLGAIGLERLSGAVTGAERNHRLRKTYLVAGVFGAVVVILGIFTAAGLQHAAAGRLAARAPGMGVPADRAGTFALQEARQVVTMAGRDVFLALFFLAAGAGLVVARIRGRIPAPALVAGVILLTVIDLWRVDAKPADYHPRTQDPTAFQATDAVRYLQQQTEPYRILPLTGQGLNNNWFAYFKIPSILGYHPAKVKIYQDLIDDQGPVGISKSLSRGNFNVVDILNMRYLVADREIQGGPLETVVRGPQFVMRNDGALPRMWFVDRARVIADPGSHLAAVADPSWKPREEALLFQDPGALDPGTGGTAKVTLYQPREIHAEVNSPGNSLLMISEVYYEPGWDAWLDGKPVEIRRADYVLRAVKVPPGRHQLKMRFDPPAFRRGVFLSLAAYALILIALGASVVVDRGRGSRGGAPGGEGEA